MIPSRTAAEPPAGGSIIGQINVKKIPGIGNVLEHSLRVSRGSTSTSTSSVLGNVVELPGVPGTDFSISAEVLLNTSLSNHPTGANIALVFLAHTSDVTVINSERHQLLLQMSGPNMGRVEITESIGGKTHTLATSTGVPLTFADDREYRLEATVRYARPGDPKSAATITAKVSSGAESQTVTFTDQTPRMGNFFGVRTGVNVTQHTPAIAASFDAEFDNFVVAPGVESAARMYTSPNRTR